MRFYFILSMNILRIKPYVIGYLLIKINWPSLENRFCNIIYVYKYCDVHTVLFDWM